MVTVAEVRPGSIAEELGIPPGARVRRINGRELWDTLDLRFYEVDPRVELWVEMPDGESVVFEIEKPAGEPLGLVPEPDPIRRCTNACPFCFVKGSPKGLRPGVYVKDDDYRLSFLYGHYVTLTNLREDEFDRIVEQRLSPLYVSVHATDPEVRLRMLRNPRARRILEDLRRLLDGGVRVHTQVVLCRGLNDGPVLDRTMEDLWGLGPGVLSLSVVPVGLTRYNRDAVERLGPEDARVALAQVDAMRARARRERGIGWCYASDELFLLAGRPVPSRAYYDQQALVENGVGAIAEFRDRARRDERRLPRLPGRRIAVVTGTLMAPVLGPWVARWSARTGAAIEVLAIENSLFGPSVTCAGLLPGGDVRRAVLAAARFDAVLVPARALNEDGRFIDDLALDALRAEVAPARVEAGDHVTDALCRL
jgi:putative radical SAM enzyme (TIGR03279 family)